MLHLEAGCLGGSHIDKTEWGGHFGGQIGCESANLGVNVAEEGVRGPSAQFLDENLVHPIQFECHCSRGSEAVRANSVRRVSMELRAPDCHSNGGNNMFVSDLLEVTFGGDKGADGGGWRLVVKVVQDVDGCLDWAESGVLAGCVMEGGIPLTIFLVGQGHCDSCGFGSFIHSFVHFSSF